MYQVPKEFAFFLNITARKLLCVCVWPKTRVCNDLNFFSYFFLLTFAVLSFFFISVTQFFWQSLSVRDGKASPNFFFSFEKKEPWWRNLPNYHYDDDWLVDWLVGCFIDLILLSVFFSAIVIIIIMMKW